MTSPIFGIYDMKWHHHIWRNAAPYQHSANEPCASFRLFVIIRIVHAFHMMAVIDTNILVSALWKPSGNASMLISAVLNGSVLPCYDHRILEEYREVLRRPKFKFSSRMVDMLLDGFVMNGISVIAKALPDISMKDENDRPFFEVAKTCNIPLVTGNIRDYPEDPLIMSLADFCGLYL